MTRLVASVGVVLLQIAAVAQTPQRFRSATELVSVDVLVTDDRQVVTGLAAADFELLDNGVRQTVDQLYIEQLPVNVVMVLDTSGSVQGERLQALKAGALSIVGRLRRNDRAAVISFSHRLTMPSALTGDRGDAAEGDRGIDRRREHVAARCGLCGAGDPRRRHRADPDPAVQRRARHRQRSRRIAGDGGCHAARTPSSTRLASATMPVVIANGRVIPQEGLTDDRFLARLARETGGRLFHAQQHRDIESTFTRVLEEFNSRYVLGYTPRGVAPGGWHKVDVRLKSKRGKVLARRGYFAREAEAHDLRYRPYGQWLPPQAEASRRPANFIGGNRVTRRISIVCLALLLTAAADAAAQRRQITHEDVWLSKRLGAPIVSPDGKWAAVQVTEPVV